MVYLAEWFDISNPRPGVVDIDSIWEEGGLTGPKERIKEMLEAQEAEAAAEDAAEDAAAAEAPVVEVAAEAPATEAEEAPAAEAPAA